ncbi:hypothetical protein U1Q18_019075 [Sarracenia purpurea var. burkii]
MDISLQTEITPRVPRLKIMLAAKRYPQVGKARRFSHGLKGGHINPAVTFGLFLAKKLSLTRAIFYIVMQCLGAICGAGVVKGFSPLSMSYWVVGPTLCSMATPRVMTSVLKLLAPLYLSTLSSLPLMPREAPETHISLWIQ